MGIADSLKFLDKNRGKSNGSAKEPTAERSSYLYSSTMPPRPRTPPLPERSSALHTIASNNRPIPSSLPSNNMGYKESYTEKRNFGLASEPVVPQYNPPQPTFQTSAYHTMPQQAFQPFESSHQQQQETQQPLTGRVITLEDRITSRNETQQPLTGRTVTLEMREAQQLMMMRESQLHSQQLQETHQTRDAQLHQFGPIQWDIAPASVAPRALTVETQPIRESQFHELGPVQWDIAPASVAIGLASEPVVPQYHAPQSTFQTSAYHVDRPSTYGDSALIPILSGQEIHTHPHVAERSFVDPAHESFVQPYGGSGLYQEGLRAVSQGMTIQRPFAHWNDGGVIANDHRIETLYASKRYTLADRARMGDRTIVGMLGLSEGHQSTTGGGATEAEDREGELIRSIFPKYEPGMMASDFLRAPLIPHPDDVSNARPIFGPLPVSDKEFVIGKMGFQSLPTWTDSLVEYLKQDPTYYASKLPENQPPPPQQEQLAAAVAPQQQQQHSHSSSATYAAAEQHSSTSQQQPPHTIYAAPVPPAGHYQQQPATVPAPRMPPMGVRAASAAPIVDQPLQHTRPGSPEKGPLSPLIPPTAAPLTPNAAAPLSPRSKRLAEMKAEISGTPPPAPPEEKKIAAPPAPPPAPAAPPPPKAAPKPPPPPPGAGVDKPPALGPPKKKTSSGLADRLAAFQKAVEESQ